MQGAALRRLRPLALLAAAVAIGTPARAAEDAEDTFRRAELAERGLGDLERACALYREVARTAATAEARALADVRAASCLRRLGRTEEARALLTPWTVERPDVPATLRRVAEAAIEALGGGERPPLSPPAPADDPAARLAEKEREAEQARQEADSALERAKGFEKELATLVERLRKMDEENARLRAAASPRAPATAEEVLALRRREIARQRQESEALARTFVKAARLLAQEGRFAEARGFLYDALEKDPENADAKALLSFVSAPLSDRVALFQKALELAALAREVRAARRSAEVANLAGEARRRQDRGDFAGSVAPLERALAWIESAPDLVRDAPARREEILRMLQTASARGAPRAPLAAPDAEPADGRWSVALRDLLSDAGREVAQGLDLRFHDLGAVADTGGLPPVPFGPEPVGWSVTTAGADAPPLLAAWLRATEPRALAAPEASFALVGATCAVLADLETHRRLSSSLAALRTGAPPAADVRIAAYRAEHAAIAGVLGARGVEAAALQGGALAATLDPADLDALLDAMPRLATGVIGAASLRVPPLRPFRLVSGPPTSRLDVAMIAVPGARPGVGVRTEISWSPQRDGTGPALRAEALAGASVAPGGGLVVFGVPDPDRPGDDVALVVRIGSAPSPSPAVPAPATPAQAADELRVPAVLATVEDPPAPPLLVPDRPVPSRADALALRLRRAAPAARLLEVKGDRVLVVGPDDARAAVAEALASLAASPGPVLLDVRFHQVAPAAERRLLDLCPRAGRAASGAFSWAVAAAGREAREVEYFLRAAEGEIPLRDPVVFAPPTGRADAARIVRTPVSRGAGTADGGTAWGRADTTWIEEGLVVSLRPFGRRKDGRVDLDVCARAGRVSDAGRRTTETPLGRVPVHDPRSETWWGDVSAPIGRGETFLLFGAVSPFSGAEPDHVVVTVRLAE